MRYSADEMMAAAKRTKLATDEVRYEGAYHPLSFPRSLSREARWPEPPRRVAARPSMPMGTVRSTGAVTWHGRCCLRAANGALHEAKTDYGASTSNYRNDDYSADRSGWPDEAL